MRLTIFSGKIFVLSSLLVLIFASCKTDSKREIFAVNIRLNNEPDKLQPFVTTNAIAGQLNELIFGKLITFDPTTLQPIPMLATSLPVVAPIDTGANKGGTAYTFELQPDAVWDNGKPILASDYIFTLKTIMNPKVPAQAWRGGLGFIKDVVPDVQNPKKFTIIANERYMMAEQVCGDIYLLPEYIYDEKGLMRDIPLSDLANEKKAVLLADKDPRLQQFADQFANPKFVREKGGVVGCGAYQLDNWATGERIVLSKKENWWGDKLAAKYPALVAHPVKLVYKVVKDNNTALTMLKEGTLDVCATIPPKAFSELQKNDAVTTKYNLYAAPTMKYFLLAFNGGNNAKLADKRVRQAIAHLLNTDQVVTTLMKGMAAPITGPILPSTDYYNTTLQPIKLDVEKARTLLKEAGWADTNGNGTVDKKVNGKTTELDIHVLVGTSGEVAQKMTLLLQEEAKKAGVNVQLDVKEQNVIQELQKKRQFDLVAMAVSLEPGLYDPYQYWHTDNNTPDGSNRFGFGNATTDKLIEDLRSTLDKTKRDALYKQLQGVIYEEQPAIFLVTPKECIAINKRLKNAAPSAMRPNYREASFEQ
ncbi:MAG: hypothetical protein KA103_01015 [Saprospiraceae bacterium]|nr:hypothetical protein [Saprospiraceae bacterium]